MTQHFLQMKLFGHRVGLKLVGHKPTRQTCTETCRDVCVQARIVELERELHELRSRTDPQASEAQPRTCGC